MRTECQECGRANPPDALYCGGCGGVLPTNEDLTGRRMTVTVLFCDASDLATLGAESDPERLRELRSHFFDVVRAVLARYGGTLEKYVGDAVMAVFGVPVPHEDDALRAVRSAAEVRAALAAEPLTAELQPSIGINTGEVLVGGADGGSLVSGDAVNVAARLQQLAGPGEILVGDDCWRVVRSTARFEAIDAVALRGRTSASAAHRLVELLPDAELVPRDLGSPLVGRDVELLLLEHAFNRCVAVRTAHLFTVLGPAGVGKSRLVAELTRAQAERATVLCGRCLPYGQGITFWPLAEVVREAAGLESAADAGEVAARLAQLLRDDVHQPLVVSRLLELLGLSTGIAAPEELAWAMRKLLESVAGDRPVIVVLDDVHWAEPSLLDLVLHVADWAQDAPILLACLARPELLDLRPSWGGGMANTTTIQLHPLSDAECEQLTEHLLGDGRLEGGLRDQLFALAEGNPLFLEQTLSMLREDGALERAGDTWIHRGGELAVPPSIHAILAARLGGLEAPERAVVEAAAVVGGSFDHDAVASLVSPRTAEQLPAILEALVRRDLLLPERTVSATGAGYRFRHLLIRDAAYRSLPKAARGDLHERFAGWLEESQVGRELEEVVGYHLEQAYTHRRELLLTADSSAELAWQAADRLASAGRRALERDDFPAAINLLGRAAALVEGDDGTRARLLPALGSSLSAVGDIERATVVLAEALTLAEVLDDAALVAHVTLLRVLLQIEADPEGAADRGRIEARRLIPRFEEHGDDLSLARCWRLLGNSYHMRCQAAAAEDAFTRALRHARQAGDRGEQSEACAGLLMMARRGPRPVDAALQRVTEMRTQVDWRQTTEIAAHTTVSALLAMRGDFDQAREQSRTAESIFRDLGLSGWSGQNLAYVELLAGRPHEAYDALHEGYAVLERLQKRGFLASQAAFLAQVCHDIDRDDEAEHFAGISREHAAMDDVDAQVGWRSALAKVEAGRGELGIAEDLARAAVRLAHTTDYPNLRGDAEADLATVLRLAGRPAEAAAALERALDHYLLKGNLVRASRARERLAAT